MKTHPLFLILVLMFPVLAFGQVDPDPDGIGVYFDLEATSLTTTAIPGDIVQAFLIGTRLAQTGDVWIWSAGLCPNLAEAQVFGSPTNGGFNYSMNMPGDPCWSCLTFGFDQPLVAQEITVLAHLDILVYGDLGPISLYIREGAYYQMGPEPGLEIFLHPSSGSFAQPVATINGPAPVSVVSATWDSLKSMYR